MAEDAPKAPKPAKPVKKAATTATPRAKALNGAVAAKPTPKPKPAKPLKGPTVDPIENPKTTTSKAANDTNPISAQALKDGAAKITKDAGNKARSYAEDGKARAGGALDELSKMINDAAGTVDEKIGAQYGQYARTAAEAVSGFSESLKAKEIDDLIADARGFVKKSPVIAIGTAAAIGFVLVRLIKSGIDAADRTTDNKA
ncbi:hypothetical protein [Sphingomonas alpina]|uniref:hypothetical protein n=1 Tax=Sphingomonas alpina TaxID=653931 RepID=UPI001E598553|nr:hypothetical protein [Sphingomonas alpina]